MFLPPEKQKLLDIAIVITDGDMNNVNSTCPYCGKHSLIFSFTIIEPPRYGLFIACTECKRVEHFSLTEKPKNFREDFVLEEFQKLENEAHNFAIDIEMKNKKKS